MERLEDKKVQTGHVTRVTHASINEIDARNDGTRPHPKEAMISQFRSTQSWTKQRGSLKQSPSNLESTGMIDAKRECQWREYP